MKRRSATGVDAKSVGVTSASREGNTEGDWDSSRLVTLSASGGVQAEAIRRLAGETVIHHLDRNHRGLAICGVSFGVGVSFIAANLAVELAQMGRTVLLVDANLHRPSVDQFIAPRSPVVGLRTLLADDRLKLQDVVVESELPNLSVIYAGADDGNEPRELLAGERFRTVVENAMREFDCTIVDTPPANQTSEARQVAQVVGYAMIVVRRDKSFASDIATFVDELSRDGVMIVGSILNAA